MAGDADERVASHLVWKQVEVDGRAVAYGEAGTGPTVLFLHGWALDHKAYKRALRRLVAAGMHVVAPAMAGFGGSDPLPDAECTLEGYAEWAAGLLAVVAPRGPVVAMGHSFGGGVAIVLAHRHPELVGGLVLINSVGGSAWTGAGPTFRSMAQRPLWDWGLHLSRDLLPLRQTRRVLPVILGEALPNLARDPRSFWRVAGLARRADLTAELEALKRRRLPVLVLWGDRDRIVTKAAFDDMCRALGSPEVVTVEGAHAWLIADPDAFGEVITNVAAVAERAGAMAGRRRPRRAAAR